jgi:hypothetical protein
MLAACTTDPADTAGGPRLVQEATLQPTDVLPVRVSTNTPIGIPVSTSEADDPDEMTEDAGTPGFVMVTPTLPPSKTPTLTPTQSPTPGPTQPATQVPRTAVAQATVVLAPPQATARSANTQPCTSPWFFGSNLISTCPQGAAMESQGVYLQFQQGFMIWVEQQDSIYVVFDSASAPRWRVFADEWADGMAERDPNMSGEAPPYTWQPRNGFGLVWVTEPGLRGRLGWAVREWEEIYTISVQVAQDGTIFMQDPRGGIIALYANGRDWDRFVNY